MFSPGKKTQQSKTEQCDPSADKKFSSEEQNQRLRNFIFTPANTTICGAKNKGELSGELVSTRLDPPSNGTI